MDSTNQRELLTPRVEIEQISSEKQLLELLRAGFEVVAYVGGKGELQTGMVLDKPYVPIEDRGSLHNFQCAIEEIRKERRPQMLSRLDSVFIAPSVQEATKWGDPYKVVLKLIDPSKKTDVQPVKWLCRNFYEDIHTYHSAPGHHDDLKEDDKAVRAVLRYFDSKGTHIISEILVDPTQVRVEVLEKEASADEGTVVARLVRKIFNPDRGEISAPEDFDDLSERIQYLGHDLSDEGKKLLLTEATRALLKRLEEDMLHNSDWYIDKDGLLTCTAIEEIKKIMGYGPVLQIFQEDDPQCVRLRTAIQLRIEKCKCTYHERMLIQLERVSKTHEATASARCLTTFDYWKDQYFKACEIAGVEPDMEQVGRLREKLVSQLKELGKI
jgi:hypothetical protein